MTHEGLEALVERAREALELPRDTPAHSWLVHAPTEGKSAYALIVFGEPSAAVAVTAVDPMTGELLSSARLPGTGPHLAMDEGRALAVARRPDGRARLVWQASRQTASPLYPLWEVSGADPGEPALYVDQAGRVSPAIEPGGPGG